LLEKARDDLNYSKILSPVNGNLTSLDVKKGALTQKGKVLASILAHGSNEIETDLRAEAAAKIVIGSKVKIKNNSSIFIGKVRGVVNKENIRTGTRKVRVELISILPQILNVSGTRFSLHISVGEPSTRLLIHKDALISRGRKQMVYIFNEGKAEQKFIKIGSSIGNKIEILQGLKEGQLV
jgi:multidrug efflux pump subunit AcrA (membrane-fusion protein)